MGAAPAAEWHVTNLPGDLDAAAIWDLCHELQTKGMGVAGGASIEFAEPDIEQQWPTGMPEQPVGKVMRAAAAKVSCDRPDPADAQFPAPNPFDWRWYQDAKHTGLDAARSEVMNATDRVVISGLERHRRGGVDEGLAMRMQWHDGRRYYYAVSVDRTAGSERRS